MAGGDPGDPVVISLLVLVGVCLFWGGIGSSRVVHQIRYHPSLTPTDYGLSWEPLRLMAADGVSISGWLIPAKSPRGILLLLHGFGTCKADLMDVAQAFHQGGPFHLILIDFRGHGDSGGRTISFGHRELRDIQAVLELVDSSLGWRHLPVGCYGISMGGAIGLLAAARFPRIRAVVTDSAYASLSKTIARIQWLSYHIPQIPLGQMVIWGTQLRLGCRMRHLSPISVIDKIAPRGVLIIHGGNDPSIPPEEGEALFRSAGEPKDFWRVPGAGHVSSFYREKEPYVQRVMGFFQDAFCRET